LEAQAENASAAQKEVKIILNGVEMDAAMNVMRQIRQPLNLKQGVNTITVRAVTKDGKDEKTVRVTYTASGNSGNSTIPSKGNPTPNTTKLPTIANFNVTQPVTDPFDPKPLVSVVTATITQSSMAGIQFKVNGETVQNFQYDSLTGQFRYSFGIKSGTTYTFYIKASNLEGDAEQTQTVKF
jgi:hypothetical protein